MLRWIRGFDKYQRIGLSCCLISLVFIFGSLTFGHSIYAYVLYWVGVAALVTAMIVPWLMKRYDNR